jgi:hypothetical protein
LGILREEIHGHPRRVGQDRTERWVLSDQKEIGLLGGAALRRGRGDQHERGNQNEDQPFHGTFLLALDGGLPSG